MISLSALRREAYSLLRRARVSLPLFAGLLTALDLLLSIIDRFCSGATFSSLLNAGIGGIFVYILTGLISLLLSFGRVEYCARIRCGETAQYSDLFWGFSYALRAMALLFLQALLISLGLSFFLLPGVILSYRYRFSLYIFRDDPTLSPVEVLRQSAQETRGFKLTLFTLDLSFLPWLIAAVLPSELWGFFAPDSLPAIAELCISAVLAFPLNLVIFWRTATEMELRERLLAGAER